MKKILLPVLLILCASGANAQAMNFNVFAGFSNYQGELQEKQFTINQSHAAFGVGLDYELTDKLHVRLTGTFGKISGDDKKSKKNQTRNLNFTSPLTEISLGLEYQLLNLYTKRFTPYIFAGISRFSFNPMAIDTAGRKIKLQPLSTEGQGFYGDRKKYKLGQFAIPFGLGVKMNLGRTMILGLEVGMRKTFTDYLDDVSTTYTDEFVLFNNRGQQAVDISYRGDELPGGSPFYPADGTQRGNEKTKDWYYFGGLTIGFRLNSLEEREEKLPKNRMGCPRF